MAEDMTTFDAGDDGDYYNMLKSHCYVLSSAHGSSCLKRSYGCTVVPHRVLYGAGVASRVASHELQGHGGLDVNDNVQSLSILANHWKQRGINENISSQKLQPSTVDALAVDD